MPNYYEEVCHICKGPDCEPVELDGCEWESVWSCQV